MDFTLNKYRYLLLQLKDSGYKFLTYRDYCNGRLPLRFVVLRHDVDLKPQNSLRIAKEEIKLGAKASYYFRAVPESWDDSIIKQIYSMGHEVGYHYESLTTCNGDMECAFDDFKDNLEKLRRLVPVTTICMHGSPRSPYDSKDIWKQYDYKILDVVGEPYLSTDFSKMFYLTDTGRRWDGYKVSVRDKIEGYQEEWNAKGWVFHTTDDIIRVLQVNQLPDQLMITTHPQRWFNFGFGWIKELVMQNVKNIVKAVIVRR
ncbi:MAG: hypothetical protein K5856_00445 [Bacteroidaceae bacterium]|nr:hypothetical protein [Bacteroidaceae bacterium]